MLPSGGGIFLITPKGLSSFLVLPLSSWCPISMWASPYTRATRECEQQRAAKGFDQRGRRGQRANYLSIQCQCSQITPSEETIRFSPSLYDSLELQEAPLLQTSRHLCNHHPHDRWWRRQPADVATGGQSSLLYGSARAWYSSCLASLHATSPHPSPFSLSLSLPPSSSVWHPKRLAPFPGTGTAHSRRRLCMTFVVLYSRLARTRGASLP